MAKPEKKEVKNLGGRPAYEKDEVVANMVMILRMGAFTHASIAAQLKIPRSTLEKHYKDELDIGSDKVTGELIAKHYEVGMKEDHKDAARCREYLMGTLGGLSQSVNVNLNADVSLGEQLARARKKLNFDGTPIDPEDSTIEDYEEE